MKPPLPTSPEKTCLMLLVLKAIHAAIIMTAQQNPDRCYWNWELVEDDLESPKCQKKHFKLRKDQRSEDGIVNQGISYYLMLITRFQL